jgi:hypothetical protein
MHHPTQIADTLRRAATHISTYGHAKDNYCAADIDQHGRPRYASTPHQFRPTCMAGAIQVACTGQPDWTNELSETVIRFAAEHMDDEIRFYSETGEPDYVEHIADWNDRPERTAQDVIGLLWRLSMQAETPALVLAVAA